MPTRQAASVLVSSAVKAGSKHRSISVAFRSQEGGVGRRDYATHWVHSYPAKMFHRIPQTIMSSVSEAGTLRVLDPFCGSGTVLLEAILNGHSAIGIDVNPLARLISSVKTTALDASRLRERLPLILARARSDRAAALPDINLDYWFKTENREALQALRRAITSIRNEEQKRFFLVSLSSIVRKTSLADPCIPPPVKLNKSRAERLKGRYSASYEHAAALDRKGVFSLFEAGMTANIKRMQELEASEGLGTAEILSSNYEAAATGLADQSVDLVITSPPYCGAQKYIRSVRLELLILGFGSDEIATADQRTLGTERVTNATALPDSVSLPLCGQLYQKIKRENPTRARIFFSYVSYLQKFAHELNRILAIGAEAFVTFGTDHVAGNRVDCAKIFARMASEIGLTHVCTLVDSIPSRGMITNRHASARTINDERVVWLRK